MKIKLKICQALLLSKTNLMKILIQKGKQPKKLESDEKSKFKKVLIQQFKISNKIIKSIIQKFNNTVFHHFNIPKF